MEALITAFFFALFVVGALVWGYWWGSTRARRAARKLPAARGSQSCRLPNSDR